MPQTNHQKLVKIPIKLGYILTKIWRNIQRLYTTEMPKQIIKNFIKIPIKLRYILTKI